MSAPIPTADELPIIAALEGKPSELTFGELWAAAGIIRALYEALSSVRDGLTTADDAYRFAGTISVTDAALAKARDEQ